MSFDPLDWIDDSLNELRHQHLLRSPTIRGGPQANAIVMDGRNHINFGANDYLSLANDARVVQAVRQCIDGAGWGSGASPLVTGRSAIQAELERHVASFEQTEACLVFPSGFAANTGTLGCLAGRGDQIFSDAKNHASLIDGCRLTRATTIVYPHCDVLTLRQLIGAQPPAKRRVIVTDSVFSMDGDLAPLADLLEIAEQYRAILVVDEAHATGVLGASGRGACELLSVDADVPVRMGTFSKALGSIGGFVVGQQRLIEWLYNRARPHVFSTALPASAYAASLAAIKIVRDEPNRRIELLSRARDLRTALAGWTMPNGVGPIVSLRIGDARQATALAERLKQHQLWVPAIRPPSVPAGESLLRISLCYGHTTDQIESLVRQLADAREALALDES